jgi:hypothetical protein
MGAFLASDTNSFPDANAIRNPDATPLTSSEECFQ